MQFVEIAITVVLACLQNGLSCGAQRIQRKIFIGM